MSKASELEVRRCCSDTPNRNSRRQASAPPSSQNRGTPPSRVPAPRKSPTGPRFGTEPKDRRRVRHRIAPPDPQDRPQRLLLRRHARTLHPPPHATRARAAGRATPGRTPGRPPPTRPSPRHAPPRSTHAFIPPRRTRTLGEARVPQFARLPHSLKVVVPPAHEDEFPPPQKRPRPDREEGQIQSARNRASLELLGRTEVDHGRRLGARQAGLQFRRGDPDGRLRRTRSDALDNVLPEGSGSRILRPGRHAGQGDDRPCFGAFGGPAEHRHVPSPRLRGMEANPEVTSRSRFHRLRPVDSLHVVTRGMHLRQPGRMMVPIRPPHLHPPGLSDAQPVHLGMRQPTPGRKFRGESRPPDPAGEHENPEAQEEPHRNPLARRSAPPPLPRSRARTVRCGVRRRVAALAGAEARNRHPGHRARVGEWRRCQSGDNSPQSKGRRFLGRKGPLASRLCIAGISRQNAEAQGAGS
jgi:hypothetical protein